MVRVSQISYPLSVVQGSLDSALDVASTITGEAVTDEDRQAGVQDIVTSARLRWTIQSLPPLRPRPWRSACRTP